MVHGARAMRVTSIVGRVLLVVGGMTAALGVLLLVVGRWLDDGGPLLPGEIFVRRGNFSFYLPLGACIAVSVVASLLLTLVFYIVGHWRH